MHSVSTPFHNQCDFIDASGFSGNIYDSIMPPILNQEPLPFHQNFYFFDQDTVNLVTVDADHLNAIELIEQNWSSFLKSDFRRLRIIMKDPYRDALDKLMFARQSAAVRISYYALSPNWLPPVMDIQCETIKFTTGFNQELFNAVLKELDVCLFNENQGYTANEILEIKGAIMQHAPLSHNLFAMKNDKAAGYFMTLHEQPASWYCPTLIGQIWLARNRMEKHERKMIWNEFFRHLNSCKFPLYGVIDLQNSRSIVAAVRMGRKPYVINFIKKN